MGKKFSELERAVSLNNGDLAAFAQVDESAATGYKSKAAPMSLVSQKILKDTEYASDLQTDNKTVLGAINEAAMDKNIANPYSNQEPYAVGDFVIYQTVLYKCITAVSVAEDFDSTKWTRAKVSDLVGAVTSNKMDKANPTGTGSLAVGDVVSASGTNSTALGSGTTASGNMSHAEGSSTYATHKCQHVFGENNLKDNSSASANSRGNYVEIVGNGADPLNRSNARTLGWDGHEMIAGDLTFNAGTTPQHLTSELQKRYTKAQVDEIIYSILPTDSTGKVATATFNTSFEKPVELIMYFNAVQAAGTPTPASPIPITGWSALELDANGTPVIISLEDTYYGGYVVQDKFGHRKLYLTYAIVDFSDLDWKRFNFSGVYCFYVQIPSMKLSYPKGLSTSYVRNTSAINPNALSNYQFLLDNGTHNGYCYLRNDDYSDATTFINAMSGVKLVYELATVVEVDLADGTPISSIVGANNFSVNSGNIEVSYKCSVEEYVANHSGGNRSLGNSYENLSKGSGGDEPEEFEEKDLKELKDDDEESGDIEPISKR